MRTVTLGCRRPDGIEAQTHQDHRVKVPLAGVSCGISRLSARRTRVVGVLMLEAALLQDAHGDHGIAAWREPADDLEEACLGE